MFEFGGNDIKNLKGNKSQYPNQTINPASSIFEKSPNTYRPREQFGVQRTAKQQDNLIKRSLRSSIERQEVIDKLKYRSVDKGNKADLELLRKANRDAADLVMRRNNKKNTNAALRN